jgi:hypothetical protein
MRAPVVRAVGMMVVALAGSPVGVRATEPADLREFRVGMSVEKLPASGYVGFACAAAPERTLSGWGDWRVCPADKEGLHEIRFRYDETTVATGRPGSEGTMVGGHPVQLSLLIGEDGRVDGLRIETDPAARLFLRKKAFLLGPQAMARYGQEGWTCTQGEPTPDEQPVGGVFIKEHCEKRTPKRHFIIDRALFRHPGQELRDFVGMTRITILGAR